MNYSDLTDDERQKLIDMRLVDEDTVTNDFPLDDFQLKIIGGVSSAPSESTDTSAMIPNKLDEIVPTQDIFQGIDANQSPDSAMRSDTIDYTSKIGAQRGIIQSAENERARQKQNDLMDQRSDLARLNLNTGDKQKDFENALQVQGIIDSDMFLDEVRVEARKKFQNRFGAGFDRIEPKKNEYGKTTGAKLIPKSLGRQTADAIFTTEAIDEGSIVGGILQPFGFGSRFTGTVQNGGYMGSESTMYETDELKAIRQKNETITNTLEPAIAKLREKELAETDPAKKQKIRQTRLGLQQELTRATSPSGMEMVAEFGSASIDPLMLLDVGLMYNAGKGMYESAKAGTFLDDAKGLIKGARDVAMQSDEGADVLEGIDDVEGLIGRVNEPIPIEPTQTFRMDTENAGSVIADRPTGTEGLDVDPFPTFDAGNYDRYPQSRMPDERQELAILPKETKQLEGGKLTGVMPSNEGGTMRPLKNAEIFYRDTDHIVGDPVFNELGGVEPPIFYHGSKDKVDKIDPEMSGSLFNNSYSGEFYNIESEAVAKDYLVTSYLNQSSKKIAQDIMDDPDLMKQLADELGKNVDDLDFDELRYIANLYGDGDLNKIPEFFYDWVVSKGELNPSYIHGRAYDSDLAGTNINRKGYDRYGNKTGENNRQLHELEKLYVKDGGKVLDEEYLAENSEYFKPRIDMEVPRDENFEHSYFGDTIERIKEVEGSRAEGKYDQLDIDSYKDEWTDRAYEYQGLDRDDRVDQALDEFVTDDGVDPELDEIINYSVKNYIPDDAEIPKGFDQYHRYQDEFSDLDWYDEFIEKRDYDIDEEFIKPEGRFMDEYDKQSAIDDIMNENLIQKSFDENTNEVWYARDVADPVDAPETTVSGEEHSDMAVVWSDKNRTPIDPEYMQKNYQLASPDAPTTSLFEVGQDPTKRKKPKYAESVVAESFEAGDVPSGNMYGYLEGSPMPKRKPRVSSMNLAEVGSGSKIPEVPEDMNRLYNSSTSDNAQSISENGLWQEKANNSLMTPDDIYDDLDTPESTMFFSESPDWVRSKVSQKLGKSIDDVTWDDIKEHGQLSIVDVYKDDPSFFRGELDADGMPKPYSENTESWDYEKSTPWGLETPDIIGIEEGGYPVDFNLTGDDLVSYLKEVEGLSNKSDAKKLFLGELGQDPQKLRMATKNANAPKPQKEVYSPENRVQFARDKDGDMVNQLKEVRVHTGEFDEAGEPIFETRQYGRNPEISRSYDKYMDLAEEKYGVPRTDINVFARIDPERSRRIADEYQKMKHDPSNPIVRSAYEKLSEEMMDQYNTLIEDGWTFDFYPRDNEGNVIDPYGDPRNAIKDMKENKHLYVYPTNDGFGTSAKFDPSENPLLGQSGQKFGEEDAMLNDIFRAVHDVFGHGMEEVGFRAQGEEHTWRSHARMFSPEARRALTTETRGQNSWLNFNPSTGAKNRVAKVEDTQFADQKTGLMPKWVSEEGLYDNQVIDRVNELRTKKGKKPVKGKENPKQFRNEIDINASLDELREGLENVNVESMKIDDVLDLEDAVRMKEKGYDTVGEVFQSGDQASMNDVYKAVTGSNAPERKVYSSANQGSTSLGDLGLDPQKLRMKKPESNLPANVSDETPVTENPLAPVGGSIASLGRTVSNSDRTFANALGNLLQGIGVGVSELEKQGLLGVRDAIRKGGYKAFVELPEQQKDLFKALIQDNSNYQKLIEELGAREGQIPKEFADEILEGFVTPKGGSSERALGKKSKMWKGTEARRLEEEALGDFKSEVPVQRIQSWVDEFIQPTNQDGSPLKFRTKDEQEVYKNLGSAELEKTLSQDAYGKLISYASKGDMSYSEILDTIRSIDDGIKFEASNDSIKKVLQLRKDLNSMIQDATLKQIESGKFNDYFGEGSDTMQKYMEMRDQLAIASELNDDFRDYAKIRGKTAGLSDYDVDKFADKVATAFGKITSKRGQTISDLDNNTGFKILKRIDEQQGTDFAPKMRTIMEIYTNPQVEVTKIKGGNKLGGYTLKPRAERDQWSQAGYFAKDGVVDKLQMGWNRFESALVDWSQKRSDLGATQQNKFLTDAVAEAVGFGVDPFKIRTKLRDAGVPSRQVGMILRPYLQDKGDSRKKSKSKDVKTKQDQEISFSSLSEVGRK